jgi:hypothetical protein
MPIHGLIMEEISHTIKDGSVIHTEATPDDFPAYGLSQMAFSSPRWTKPQHIAFVPDELTCSHVIDAILLNGVVKCKVKIAQAFLIAKIRQYNSTIYHSTATYKQFVLQYQLQELPVAQAATRGFL